MEHTIPFFVQLAVVAPFGAAVIGLLLADRWDRQERRRQLRRLAARKRS